MNRLISSSGERIVDVVFDSRSSHSTRRIVVALALALGVHGILWFWGMWLAPKHPPRMEPQARQEFVVDMEHPTPKLSTPIEETPTVIPEKPTVPTQETVVVKIPKLPPALAPPQDATPSETPPPPAEAGQIIGAEPDSSAPVDLTGNTFVVGEGSSYAGGVSSSSGTNDKPVYTFNVDPEGTPGGQYVAPPPEPTPTKPKKNLSEPVQLLEQDWHCAWPKEADDQQIDEQSAIVRVEVNKRGKVLSARILSDPGYGFGEAALFCAERTYFSPARNEEGKAITALSPPIRVRFTR